MFVQLFGGDHPDTLSAPNLACLAQTLTKTSPKRQRILLKVRKLQNLSYIKTVLQGAEILKRV